MNHFWEEIPKFEASDKNMMYVVASGEAAGERMLLTGEEGVFVNSEDSFLAGHSDELRGLSGYGLYRLEDQEIFYEQLSGKARLVICGAGNVATALTRQAVFTGFEVTVIDDRPTFANDARAAGADQVLCDAFPHALEQIRGGKDAYFVVMTRGHRHDMDCLPIVLEKDFAYVGMMASRRRTSIIRETLKEMGFDETVIEKIHMPIGMDIAAETPEEIAVSIIGEMIRTRNLEARSFGYPEEILDTIAQFAESEKRPVMATIIRKRGSGPRETGAKMLFLPDGRLVGTIGGGCAEADVAAQARRMHLHAEEKVKICHVDMTADEAAEEGMVCGGTFEVLLEKL